MSLWQVPNYAKCQFLQNAALKLKSYLEPLTSTIIAAFCIHYFIITLCLCTSLVSLVLIEKTWPKVIHKVWLFPWKQENKGFQIYFENITIMIISLTNLTYSTDNSRIQLSLDCKITTLQDSDSLLIGWHQMIMVPAVKLFDLLLFRSRVTSLRCWITHMSAPWRRSISLSQTWCQIKGKEHSIFRAKSNLGPLDAMLQAGHNSWARS